MSLRRSWFVVALLCASLAAPAPVLAAPGANPAPANPAGAETSAQDEHGSHGDPEGVDVDGLTPVQRAKLETFQRAVEERNSAATSVAQALEAANLAAGVATKAVERADVANQEAAAAALTASVAELQAARMRVVVDGYAHELASGQASGDEVLVSLVISGKSPAEVLRLAESSQRTASTITDALRSLVQLTRASDRAHAAAVDAQARAAAQERRAARKARQAASMLVEARDRYAATRTTLSTLVDGDPVVSAVTSYTEVPGCGAADQANLYPNGLLPGEVLCEPTAAPGHRMRSDAARAFDALARAYAADTGETLCITDSYRSLDAQIALKAVKPTLAAIPGTSNHGWGIAIDMCGGIENFDTPQHNWMRANGPMFGWMHPSWAQADGSKPEPWHWEFSPELADHMRALFGDLTTAAKGKGAKKGLKGSQRADGPARQRADEHKSLGVRKGAKQRHTAAVR